MIIRFSFCVKFLQKSTRTVDADKKIGTQAIVSKVVVKYIIMSNHVFPVIDF